MRTILSFDDLIAREAHRIAKNLIETELEKQNLPLPKDSSLTIHADALIAARPEIREMARTHVEAKRDAYTESLKSIGIDAEPVDPIDLGL